MAALAPLRESGKLVAVHYQFPPWFTNRQSAREWLLAARDRHPDDLLAVEFRHRSWYDGDAWPATEDLLRELDFVYVGVDVAADRHRDRASDPGRHLPRLCITRFHGRNRQTWYSGGPTSGDRFNYLYTPSELAEWVPAIRAVSDDEVPVHVLLNNNQSNYAVVNAFDFGALLGLRLPRPPAPIIETLRERDGAVPDWVEMSEPMAPPPPESGGERDAPESGGQLDLSL